MAYVVTDACIDILDKSCLLECPVDCLYLGERMMYIHPAECVDCGACEPACPQNAIFHEEDVPEDKRQFSEANTVFFAELGSPGGSQGIDASDHDAPVVVAFPQRPLTA